LIPFGNKKNGFDAWPDLPKINTGYNTFEFTKHPTKNQAMMSIIREFRNFMVDAAEMIKDGVVPVIKAFKHFITSLSYKEENRSCIDDGTLAPEAVADYDNKGRIFALHKDSFWGRPLGMRKIERTYYEDANLIYPGSRNFSVHNEIGTSWIKGGAKMKYDALWGELGDEYEEQYRPLDPTYRSYKLKKEGTQKFFEGDIKGLDTSIGAMQLVYYQMFAMQWVQRDDKDPFYLLFQCILEGLAEMLAGKTVRWLEDFMLILGFMPSGSLETSHGNSWIMINFYWLAYIFHTMATVDIDTRKLIWMLMIARRIIALFFGDDFIASCPRNLDIISIEGFAEFIWKFYGVDMKRKATYSSLISYFVVANSTVVRTIYQGPAYLKRQFVLSTNFCLDKMFPEISPIVPWRPIAQYKWRMSVPKDRGCQVFRNLSRLIGLAYDTLGIEPLAFAMIEFKYNLEYNFSCSVHGKVMIDRMIPELMKEDQKYLLKIGMQGIPERFPSYYEVLCLNHLDVEYHRPKHKETRTWQESVLEVELY